MLDVDWVGVVGVLDVGGVGSEVDGSEVDGVGSAVVGSVAVVVLEFNEDELLELDELEVELELDVLEVVELDVLEVVELLEAVETELLDVDEEFCSFSSAQPVKIAEIAKIPAASLILFIIFLPNCIFSPL